MKLSELAGRLDAELLGDGNIEIRSVAALDTAGPGQLSFLANPRYLRQLQTTGASAVIVEKSVRSDRTALLLCRDPYYAFREAVVALHGFRTHPFEGVHPKAHVEPSAVIGPQTVIYPGCYIGPRVRIGAGCILYPNVVVYEDCVIGDRCILHAGVSIGADGFGFATHEGVHHKIPQIGNVIVEDDVEIGPNSSISRAALSSTVIGKGTKIDQNVVIGHNTRVGPHCLLVAQVGIAGSCTLGHHVVLAGQVGVAGHRRIADGVQVAAQGGVMQDIETPGQYGGTPTLPLPQARRVWVTYGELPAMQRKLRELEQRLADLMAEDGGIL
ncbi:MAG: UDP-3-O-(3-hydroxymyristoyl)glucosamine N-acyltransferase [Phycisphaerales bacterium]|nr:UDP-3-O-(3-hydroxymyristoyl)glucosamine N-acyltransferase [Phycisphaerales bacterium]